MRLRLVISVLGILVSSGLAQEARYIELPSISEPRSGELAYGSMIEAYSCVGAKEQNTQQARISLEWMETTDLYPGQRVGVEFRVDNIGTTPLRLPIHPNFTDLQPKDPAEIFTYYRMRLPLEALVPAEGSALVAGGLDLYGSFQQPDTFITLKPGEWIRVKGDVAVQRWYKVDQAITVSTDLGLSKYIFPAGKSRETIPSNQQCKLERSTGGTPLNAYMHAEPQR
jgi:hypothetical protein